MGRPRGPAPFPTELHRRRGNPSHKSLPRGITVLEPVVSREMAALRTGDELVRNLLAGPASTWIGEPDTSLLELLREGWDERIRLQDAIADLPPGWTNGRYSPAVFIRLDRVERNLTTWLSLLGLTPADRSRLGVAEVRARSKLDALRERRDARPRRDRTG